MRRAELKAELRKAKEETQELRQTREELAKCSRGTRIRLDALRDSLWLEYQRLRDQLLLCELRMRAAGIKYTAATAEVEIPKTSEGQN